MARRPGTLLAGLEPRLRTVAANSRACREAREIAYDCRHRFQYVAASNTPPRTKAAGIPEPIECAGAALHAAQGGTVLTALVWAWAPVIAPMHNQMATVSDLMSVSSEVPISDTNLERYPSEVNR